MRDSLERILDRLFERGRAVSNSSSICSSISSPIDGFDSPTLYPHKVGHPKYQLLRQRDLHTRRGLPSITCFANTLFSRGRASEAPVRPSRRVRSLHTWQGLPSTSSPIDSCGLSIQGGASSGGHKAHDWHALPSMHPQPDGWVLSRSISSRLCLPSPQRTAVNRGQAHKA